MTHRNPWKTVSSRIAYSNQWIQIREDQVIRPDGKPGIYGVVEVRPSVGIVAINERDEVALVGQWRYTLDRYTWEIPRGGSAPGETDLLTAAKRELAEEVGVQARTWLSLGEYDVCSGVTTDIQYLYLATELQPVQAHQDDVEEIIVRWCPFTEALRLAVDCEIREVCTLAALLKVDRLRTKQALPPGR